MFWRGRQPAQRSVTIARANNGTRAATTDQTDITDMRMMTRLVPQSRDYSAEAKSE